MTQADIDRWASEIRAGGIPDACNRYVGMTPALYESYATGHAKRAEARPFAAAESGGEVTRPHRSEAELRQRRIEQEAERRWRDWRGPGRPRLTTFEKQVRDEFAAKARKVEAMSLQGPKEKANAEAREKRVNGEAHALGKAAKLEAARKAHSADVAKATEVKPKAKAKAKAKPAPKAKDGKTPSKTEKAIAMLKKGATRKQIAEATDWPSINLKPIAKRHGFRLKEEEGVFFAV